VVFIVSTCYFFKKRCPRAIIGANNLQGEGFKQFFAKMPTNTNQMVNFINYSVCLLAILIILLLLRSSKNKLNHRAAQNAAIKPSEELKTYGIFGLTNQYASYALGVVGISLIAGNVVDTTLGSSRVNEAVLAAGAVLILLAIGLKYVANVTNDSYKESLKPQPS
jgi:hypothetical protein